MACSRLYAFSGVAWARAARRDVSACARAFAGGHCPCVGAPGIRGETHGQAASVPERQRPGDQGRLAREDGFGLPLAHATRHACEFFAVYLAGRCAGEPSPIGLLTTRLFSGINDWRRGCDFGTLCYG